MNSTRIHWQVHVLPPRVVRAAPPREHLHWPYRAHTDLEYRHIADHIGRNRQTAIVLYGDPPARRELWVGGLWLGEQPMQPPPPVPLLGRLCLPLLRFGLRRGLFGWHASAAICRVLWSDR